jgi:hypothetical protein
MPLPSLAVLYLNAGHFFNGNKISGFRRFFRAPLGGGDRDKARARPIALRSKISHTKIGSIELRSAKTQIGFGLVHLIRRTFAGKQRPGVSEYHPYQTRKAIALLANRVRGAEGIRPPMGSIRWLPTNADHASRSPFNLGFSAGQALTRP